MSDFLREIFELLGQLTGHRRPGDPNILLFSIPCFFWFSLLVISRLRYKNQPNHYEKLLTLGFAAALFGTLITLSVQFLSFFEVVPQSTFQLFFPPLVRSLADLAEFLIAGAYIRFLTQEKSEATSYLKYSLAFGSLVYLATAAWWWPFTSNNPQIGFSDTWCDWAIRFNACIWLGIAIVVLWVHSSGWARYWVCAALFSLFTDDFLQIVDMYYESLYKNDINRVRSLFHLLGVIILGYVFIRQQANGVKQAFDSLEDTVDERTSDLKEASKQLQVSLDQQIRFTADASHEIRTPVAMIMQEAHWALEKERQIDEYQDSLQVCQSAARHMKDLIENLLEIARSDSEQILLHKKHVDLKEFCRETMPILIMMAEEKNIQFIFETREKASESFIDTTKIRQILINLVSNAIRYSHPATKIVLTLKRSQDIYSLAVRDEGAGISSQDLPHIFERFYRGDKARSDASEGVGLGLAVSHVIATAHGGELKAESSEGEGSVFTLTLPA